ncbi:MAG: hypothetical protein C5S48_01910 [Candidatus Methanogaster sp.]|nr:MAG: hypothetical protein C5S48_01910 [ANME-2 cluster archaeon]
MEGTRILYFGETTGKTILLFTDAMVNLLTMCRLMRFGVLKSGKSGVSPNVQQELETLLLWSFCAG